MRRTAVGIIALAFLAVAGYGFSKHGFDGEDTAFLWNSCWRMGLVLGTVWLALPQLLEKRADFSPIVLILGIVTALVIVIRPKAIVFLWPIFLIIGIVQFFRWLARPPEKKRR